ncbi:MAG: hypothetical protein INH41_02480 [Myxococcaceae bacterium]|jgi:hypothetical protein|nr:hypothetical protein [Myxococcaceae bacterium]
MAGGASSRAGAALPLEALGLHEATLVAVDAGGLPARLGLWLEGVLVCGRLEAVELVFRDVGGLRRDGRLLDALVMERPDAEVLSLSPTPEGPWSLVLRWRDFTQGGAHTAAYEVTARCVEAFASQG